MGRRIRHRPVGGDRAEGGALKRLAALLALLLGGAASAAAGGDPARGERLFQRCYACHAVQASEDDLRLEGPSLRGIVGRPAGALAGFDYSQALRRRAAAGLVWNEAALDAFLADPQGFLPGNRMAFFGLPAARDRADLIAYLRQAR